MPFTFKAVESIEPKDELTFRVQVRGYKQDNRVVVFATYTGWEHDYEVEVTDANFTDDELITATITITDEQITLAKMYLDNYAQEMQDI